jgi:septal ring factor EnvC (AmiA/AmiB activator)
MLCSSVSNGTMVDSRKGETMAETQDDPTGRLEVVVQKLDRLSASVDERFNQVDERFNQVDERFNQVDERFNQVDERFKQVDERFKQVDKRFKQVDKRFDQIDKRFDGIEAALLEQREYTEFAYGRLDAKFDGLSTGFARLERKMDQIIDLHLPNTPPESSDAAR